MPDRQSRALSCCLSLSLSLTLWPGRPRVKQRCFIKSTYKFPTITYNIRIAHGLAMGSLPSANEKSHRLGLVVAGSFGAIGLALVAVTTPFLLPALRRYCLPYVPATDAQLHNLSRAFRKHSKLGDSFIDVGSGDGRICRLAGQLNIYSQVHGVELNNWLVLYSRLKSFGSSNIKFYRRDLWKFPLKSYDSICIFGVDTMMEPLEAYLRSQNERESTIYACRFPFKNIKQIDELGEGIDTVWVYRL